MQSCNLLSRYSNWCIPIIQDAWLVKKLFVFYILWLGELLIVQHQLNSENYPHEISSHGLLTTIIFCIYLTLVVFTFLH